MHIHFRLLFRRASEPSSSDRTAKQQIAYAQNSSIIQEIWNKIKVQFSSIRNKNQADKANACRKERRRSDDRDRGAGGRTTCKKAENKADHYTDHRDPHDYPCPSPNCGDHLRTVRIHPIREQKQRIGFRHHERLRTCI